MKCGMRPQSEASTALFGNGSGLEYRLSFLVMMKAASSLRFATAPKCFASRVFTSARSAENNPPGGR
jgi:hypothetical protein